MLPLKMTVTVVTIFRDSGHPRSDMEDRSVGIADQGPKGSTHDPSLTIGNDAAD
jgi:hypothetical protein